jgi:hypothetical protein
MGEKPDIRILDAASTLKLTQGSRRARNRLIQFMRAGANNHFRYTEDFERVKEWSVTALGSFLAFVSWLFWVIFSSFYGCLGAFSYGATGISKATCTHLPLNVRQCESSQPTKYLSLRFDWLWPNVEPLLKQQIGRKNPDQVSKLRLGICSLPRLAALINSSDEVGEHFVRVVFKKHVRGDVVASALFLAALLARQLYRLVIVPYSCQRARMVAFNDQYADMACQCADMACQNADVAREYADMACQCADMACQNADVVREYAGVVRQYADTVRQYANAA